MILNRTLFIDWLIMQSVFFLLYIALHDFKTYSTLHFLT